MIIVGLIVLVPLVPCVHSVEVLGLARSVLVMPPIYLQTSHTTVSYPAQPKCLTGMHCQLAWMYNSLLFFDRFPSPHGCCYCYSVGCTPRDCYLACVPATLG